jgi:cytochrome c-type biogenesis protein CcmE
VNKRARTRLIVVTAIILVVVAVLFVRAVLSGGFQVNKTVAQVRSEEAQLIGKNIQVMGMVQPKTIRRGAAGLRFEVTNDGKLTVPVLFNGPVPATFKEGANVIVNGKLGADGVVNSRDMITKCPSKFQAAQTKALSKGAK